MEILKKATPPPAVFGRRGFLTGVGATLVHAAIAEYAWPRSASAQRLGGDPFTLGVASGDPTPDGVVLWTRLALNPLEGNGGMPDRPVVVQWRISTDDQMWRIVDRGSVWALPALGHSVHVEVQGLRPGRWYFYQFKVGNEYSPIGRTRTAPALNAAGELSFAFVSCQHFANGYYYAHRHLAQESLDFAVHLGDYIYEGRSTSAIQRPHLPDHEITSIEDYRIRYGLYKSDADLRAVHAAFPWVVTWDDHETENDYAGFTPENPADPADNMPDFASRRARAYQAYYEHMPLRAAQLPVGPYLQLYRRLRFGRLISLNVLDTRQYRTHRAPANCPIDQRIFANSTIRMAFLHASPTSTTSPICVSMLLSCPRSSTPVIARRHIGTISTTASGNVRLSYCPASTRKTTMTAKAKTNAAVLPACCCWYASSVHS